MLRSFLSLFRTHRIRLLSMSAIFGVVVLMLTLVSQIIKNIDNQILIETKPIVWADMIISSNQDFATGFIEYIATQSKIYNAQILRAVQFYTTVWQWTDPKLVQVKGIQKWYPRYGELELKIIWTGEIGVYLDQETYDLISGSWYIQLWELRLPVLAIITKQASLGFNFLDEGRTILMPYDLVKQTKLTDIGSRVQYEIQIKLVDDTQWQSFKNAIETIYKKQYQVSLAAQRVSQLQWLVEQLNQYTSIILIITVVLSLTIMSIASTTMTIQIKQALWVMRVLGLRKKQVLLLCIALFASSFVLGLFWGIGWSFWLFQIITTFPLALDFIWFHAPVVVSIMVWIISFIIACRNPLRFLVDTHPLVLLKSSEMQLSKQDRVFWFIIWIVWSILILYLLTSALLFSAIVVVAWLLLGVILYNLIMRIFRRLNQYASIKRSTHFSRFDATREAILPGNQTGLLVGGLMMSLLAFVLITALSMSFIDRLRLSSLDQPNVFVLNVRNEDIQTINTIDTKAVLYDTILGRIQSINGVALGEYLKQQKKTESNEFTREFNSTTRLLKNSPIIQGVAMVSGAMSLDESFAESLWVKIGDRMSFFVQWRVFDLKITSLRKRISTGTEPFFYIQLDAGQFEKAPRSRFRVTRKTDVVEFKKLALEKVGGHLSFVDIEAIINLVSDVSTKIIAVVLACMILIILLIICVSVASNEASALLSKNGYRLYHILGMKQSDLIKKSLRLVFVYAWIIIWLLLIIAPILLTSIYGSASLLTWSWSTLWIIIPWIIIVVAILGLSYWGFHRKIIKSLGK